MADNNYDRRAESSRQLNGVKASDNKVQLRVELARRVESLRIHFRAERSEGESPRGLK